jgi:hypothetical protein
MFAQEPRLAREINRLLAVMAVGAAENCNISPAQGSLFYGGERCIPGLP